MTTKNTQTEIRDTEIDGIIGGVAAKQEKAGGRPKKTRLFADEVVAVFDDRVIPA